MRKKILVIIVIILIAVICNLFFFNLGKGNLKADNTKIEEKTDKYIGKDEKIITDKDLIERIQEKDNKLSYFFVLKNIGIKHIPGETTLENIVEYLFTTPEAHEISKEEFMEYTGCDCYDQLEEKPLVILKDDVNKYYKEIYGKTAEELYVYFNTGGYTYRTNVADFDGTTVRYKDPKDPDSAKATVTRENIKYTEDDNYYYLYFYYAATVGEYTYKGMIDWNNNGFSPDESRKSLKIDSNNYSEFPLVKIFYKKSGSDFFFEKAELLKE